MKKRLLLLAAFIMLTSCTFTEHIYINEDGSGNYSFAMDGSSLMAMMPKDSLGKDKAVDSTFSFKQLFEEKKDSIAKLSAEEQARLKKMENFTMNMKMNTDKKQFLFSIGTPFKSVSDLQEVMNDMEGLQKMNKSKQNTKGLGGMVDPSLFSGSGTKINYTYDGVKFSRKAIVDKAMLKKLESDSLAQYKMIFEASKYVVEYHFPKPVKTISNKEAVFSKDRKTVMIHFKFDEFLKEPEKMNLDVVFQ